MESKIQESPTVDKVPFTPAASISFFAASIFSSDLPDMMIWKSLDAEAITFVVAYPIPELAPVIRIILDAMLEITVD